MFGKRVKRICFAIIGLVILAGSGFFLKFYFSGAVTIGELLRENRNLKSALVNLTSEDQIGYAKVVRTEEREGRKFTIVRFVETDRGDKTKVILQKEYAIAGDIVYFDALIVKFDKKLVMDGRGRALYLWRRVYGEDMSPSEAWQIESPEDEPVRYKDLLREFDISERKLFWDSIWQLARDTEELSEHGIEAVYGTVVYSRLREGLIYVFKITPSGQLYPEIVPDM
jgi:hypothetical protein